MLEALCETQRERIVSSMLSGSPEVCEDRVVYHGGAHEGRGGKGKWQDFGYRVASDNLIFPDLNFFEIFLHVRK